MYFAGIENRDIEKSSSLYLRKCTEIGLGITQGCSSGGREGHLNRNFVVLSLVAPISCLHAKVSSAKILNLKLLHSLKYKYVRTLDRKHLSVEKSACVNGRMRRCRVEKPFMQEFTI